MLLRVTRATADLFPADVPVVFPVLMHSPTFPQLRLSLPRPLTWTSLS
jgi:hypothetical protein